MEKLGIYKVQKFRSNRFFFGAVWLMFVLFISVIASKIVLLEIYDVLGISRPDEKSVMLEFPEDAGLFDVADILEKAGVINYKHAFIAYAFVRKFPKKVDNMDLEIKTNLDYEAIVRKFKLEKSGDARQVVEVVFREGMTTFECAELLEKYEVCSKKEFLKCCNDRKIFFDFDMLKNLSVNKNKFILAEGFLFPDTYKFYKNDNAKNVIRKMLSNFSKKMNKKIDYEGRNASLIEFLNEKQSTLGLEKILTIASMIEAEAADKEDMYMVSSVIYNRLDTVKNDGVNRFGEYGMNVLRIDATLNYPEKEQHKSQKNNLYNTYKIIGLPPGPICNPGADAILAAIFPKSTNYFYYCHSKDGKAFYAQTNEFHLENRRRAGLE